jgi:hypothetical protein
MVPVLGKGEINCGMAPGSMPGKLSDSSIETTACGTQRCAPRRRQRSVKAGFIIDPVQLPRSHKKTI